MRSFLTTIVLLLFFGVMLLPVGMAVWSITNPPPCHTYHIQIIGPLGNTIYNKKIKMMNKPIIWDNMTPGIISVQDGSTAFSKTIVSTSNLNTVSIERIE